MADIVNSTMFTNGVNGMISCNTTDLLQQAFQDVVDSQDQSKEFVTFLTSDGDDSHTLYLTHDEAATLRLTFETDDVQNEEKSPEILYEPCENEVFNNINETYVTPDVLPQEMKQANLTTVPQWKTNSKIKICEEADVNMTLKAFDMAKVDVQPPGELLSDQKNIHTQQSNVQAIFVPHSKINSIKTAIKDVEPNSNGIQLTMDKNHQRFSSNSLQVPQVLQSLPVIVPSSQYIIKPAQTIFKAGKNVRIVPNTNKAPINQATKKTLTINSTGLNNQNSILLPKVTLVNSLNPQVVKTTSATKQSIHTNEPLDSSQILLCDLSNQNITYSGGNTISNGSIRPIQSLGNGQFRVSPFPSPIVMQQREVTNQLKTSVKPSPESSAVKPLMLNGMNSSVSGPLIKSRNVPSQILKTASVKVAKTLNTSTKVNASSSMIMGTGPRLQPQLLKAVTSNSGTISRTPTSTVSTPISILKSQAKVAFSNGTSHAISKSQNGIANGNKLIENGNLVQKLVRRVQPNVVDNIKLVHKANDDKVGQKEVSSVKSTKIMNSQSNAVPINGQDSTRPLGSSENPIQIVQQGQTFHSMQRLTQTQLKHIAHVLQQKSQESPPTNERVVYRVVFPEEFNLRIGNNINLLKGRGGKRGRPKKKSPTPLAKIAPTEEDVEEMKGERKKPVARTRSGRLSRPPRHIVRDYKHLNPLDFMQPDLDDSDGGYSDYNVNMDSVELEEGAKDLLTGYECPKRKISDHFRCPTCNKIYLGRTRMMKHFEVHPDHGSSGQLPPRTAEPEQKRSSFPQDPFKRKGKKRGPWAYITPEAKSERRQVKLKEALSACNTEEILKIAAKPVLDAQSLFQLMVLKSNNSLKTFMNDFKALIQTTREQVQSILSPVNGEGKCQETLNLDDQTLCDALGLMPGAYNISDDIFQISKSFCNTSSIVEDEPSSKKQRLSNGDNKGIIADETTSEFSQTSNINVPDYVTERKLDSTINSNCPEVLTALTLMPRTLSPPAMEASKSSNVSKLLLSNPEIQSQMCDSAGFQKITMNIGKSSSFEQSESIKSAQCNYGSLNESLEISTCSSVFPKLEPSFNDAKLEALRQNFIKLESIPQCYVKLETDRTYEKESQTFGKLNDGFENIEDAEQTFKGFQKLIKIDMANGVDCGEKSTTLNGTDRVCKLSDSLPIIQDTIPIMSTCDTSIFGSTDNLDLFNSGVMDKHLIMDEKLVELNLVDQSNLVDELVSERLKNIMPDTMLENNLMNSNSNLDAELDFEAFSAEFNGNTES